MTNGEMIQKIFNCEVCEPIIEEDIIHVIFPDKNDSAIGFDWSWWNMEYKEPTTKNNLGVDCISRKAVLELLEDTNNGWIINEVLQLPSVTPQEPTPKKDLAVASECKLEDCMQTIVDVLGGYTDLDIPRMEDIAKDIMNALPSVYPKSDKPSGKWGKDGECPYCGYIQQWEDDVYCGHCGAKMA